MIVDFKSLTILLNVFMPLLTFLTTNTVNEVYGDIWSCNDLCPTAHDHVCDVSLFFVAPFENLVLYIETNVCTYTTRQDGGPGSRNYWCLCKFSTVA
jgi:hypothetical protein